MVPADFVFTLLDNPAPPFEITFIDHSGTRFCAVMRWFFADIRERCENRKHSEVPEKFWFREASRRLQQLNVGPLVSNRLNPQVDVNY
jgi:hypothetical protein